MASWKDRATSVQPDEPEEPKVSSWKDRATPAKMIPSQLEAGLRGAAQGATFNSEDEIAGFGGAIGTKLGQMGVDKIESTHPEVQAQIDALKPPEKSFGDLYRESRDEERSINKAAEEAHPGTYLASNVVGGFANPAAKAASSFKGALAFGGASGLGGSEADLTKGEFKDAAIDTAIGTGAGAAGFGVGKAIPGAINLTRWAGKKALTNLGPTAEAIQARLSGKAQDASKSYGKLAEEMGVTLKELGAKTKQLGEEAAQHLSSEPVIPKASVTTVLDDSIKSLGLQGKTIGPVDKHASSVLTGLRDDLNQLADDLSEKDLKAIIKKMDDNINWDDQSMDKLNTTLEGIRTKFDQALKFRNTNYKNAMKPVAEQTRLISDLKAQFNFRGVPGKGLRPKDTTGTKLMTSLRENKDVTEGNLKLLAKLTGKDYSELAKDYQLAKQFQIKSPSASSKKTNIGGAIGAGIGALTAGPLGAAAGAGLGAAAGGTMDAYGGKVAAKIIDSYLKAGNSAAFGKFAPAIQKAAAKGPEALAVVSSVLSSNPEFKKQMGLDQ